ncbi:hypothetical protein SAMN04244548_02986 [Paracoccus pantotrophus]|nr:hypothetical protein SAMN04244548_02986 [Paracoccus pantotrophus]
MDPKSTGQDSGGTALADLDRAWRAFDGRAHRDDDRVVSSWDSFLALCDAMKALAALTPADQAVQEAWQKAINVVADARNKQQPGPLFALLNDLLGQLDDERRAALRIGARSASRSWQEPTDLDPAFSEWSRNASKGQK